MESTALARRQEQPMISWYSLLAGPQADVTIERIASLAATTGTEPLTVDFKEKASPPAVGVSLAIGFSFCAGYAELG
jgi:hypothetical protein